VCEITKSSTSAPSGLTARVTLAGVDGHILGAELGQARGGMGTERLVAWRELDLRSLVFHRLRAISLLPGQESVSRRP
jgi:hypothetical protein